MTSFLESSFHYLNFVSRKSYKPLLTHTAVVVKRLSKKQDMSGKSRKSNGFHQQRRIQSFGNQNEDIENQQRKTSFKNVFRGAQMVGLFPVSGLDKESSGIEFRPASLRLFATICFVLAVVILEGLGILHMLLFNEDNNPSSDFKHHSTISSNFAPVLHYGTTVRDKVCQITDFCSKIHR